MPWEVPWGAPAPPPRPPPASSVQPLLVTVEAKQEGTMVSGSPPLSLPGPQGWEQSRYLEPRFLKNWARQGLKATCSFQPWPHIAQTMSEQHLCSQGLT